MAANNNLERYARVKSNLFVEPWIAPTKGERRFLTFLGPLALTSPDRDLSMQGKFAELKAHGRTHHLEDLQKSN